MERKLKKSEQTLKRLQDSMVGLLNQKPYEKITVASLAEKCGINRTTFYLFYSSKEELLLDISNNFLEEYIEIFVESLKYEDEIELPFVRKAFENLVGYEKMLKAIWNVHTLKFDPYVMMEQSVAKVVSHFLCVNKLRMKYGGTIELFANLYAANVMATVKWWIYNYKDYDIELIKNMINDCNHRGLLFLLEK